MTTDTLVLGGIVFSNAAYMPPERMPFGGKQALKIHKLPGGSRVFDVLGPDEHDIKFSGLIFANDATATAQSLDALRASGEAVSLVFGGMFRFVIVEDFQADIRRFPQWVEYSVTCVVASNPALGSLALGIGAIDALVGADLGSALAGF